MKNLWLSLALLSAASCDRSPNSAPPPKIESVNDIPTPTNVGPPVQAMSYDDGYKAGDLAGEAAVKSQRARAPKHRPAQPSGEEIDVLALETAGQDTTRGQKWQRGFAAGFKDGFVRAAEGKR
jgi:hypothetical protein